MRCAFGRNPEYRVGTTKRVLKFAWTPVLAENTLVWLEDYYQVYEYRKCHVRGFLGSLWDFNWVKVDRELIDGKVARSKPLTEGSIKTNVKTITADMLGTQAPPPPVPPKDRFFIR